MSPMSAIFTPTRRDILSAGLAAAGLSLLSDSSFAATTERETQTMPHVTTKDDTEIFYKDWGPKDATPIVFHHGWPLSADDWDNQMMFFLMRGYRVIAHDRRGHGRSTQTW